MINENSYVFLFVLALSIYFTSGYGQVKRIDIEDWRL